MASARKNLVPLSSHFGYMTAFYCSLFDTVNSQTAFLSNILCTDLFLCCVSVFLFLMFLRMARDERFSIATTNGYCLILCIRRGTLLVSLKFTRFVWGCIHRHWWEASCLECAPFPTSLFPYIFFTSHSLTVLPSVTSCLLPYRSVAIVLITPVIWRFKSFFLILLHQWVLSFAVEHLLDTLFLFAWAPELLLPPIPSIITFFSRNPFRMFKYLCWQSRFHYLLKVPPRLLRVVWLIFPSFFVSKFHTRSAYTFQSDFPSSFCNRTWLFYNA